MSKPAPKPDAPQPDADLLAFRRRMAEQGMIVRLPGAGPHPELPPPIDLGLSVSEMVIRLRYPPEERS